MFGRLIYLCDVANVALTFASYARVYRRQLREVGALAAQEDVRHYCRKILLSAGQTMCVEGELPSLDTGHYVIVSTHASYLDVFTIGALLTGKFTAAAAQEYMRWFVIGPILCAHNCIAIDRSDGKAARESLLRLGAEAIAQGFSVVGFPEGTRTRDGYLQPLKTGLFQLASNTSKKIVSIHIQNAFEAANRRDWRVQPGELVVRISPHLIDPKDLTVAEIAEHVREEFIWLGAKELP